MTFLMLLGYASLAVFVVAVGVRAYHFANTPTHVRWELYPVPHEPPHRAKHGGSYFELVDWWDKPHETSMFHELVDMVGEMVFIKALYKARFKQWIVSFPFHFGLYILMVFIVALFSAAVLGALGILVPGEGVGRIVGYLLGLMGAAGFALMALGAVGLLFRRLTDPDLKDFTGPIDLLNLVLFIGLGMLGLLTLALDPTTSQLVAYFQGQVTLQPAQGVSFVTGLTVAYACVLVAYIPLTHMSHFVAKYFTWHSVRWNDKALRPGNDIDLQIQEQLQWKVSWSAEHVGSDGKKSWAEVATTNPFREEKK
jgi:nitrate reductase gamma subunit